MKIVERLSKARITSDFQPLKECAILPSPAGWADILPTLWASSIELDHREHHDRCICEKKVRIINHASGLARNSRCIRIRPATTDLLDGGNHHRRICEMSVIELWIIGAAKQALGTLFLQAKARTGPWELRSSTPKKSLLLWECSSLLELSNCKACFAANRREFCINLTGVTP